KSSSLFPPLIAATSQRGLTPRPAQVSPEGPRYLGGTFFPFNVLPPPRPPTTASASSASAVTRVLQICARTCVVDTSHLAPLATKGFFEKCRKHPQNHADGRFADLARSVRAELGGETATLARTMGATN